MDERAHLKELQEQVEAALRNSFRGREPRGDIYDAMEYSLLAGGQAHPAGADPGGLPYVRRRSGAGHALRLRGGDGPHLLPHP